MTYRQIGQWKAMTENSPKIANYWTLVKEKKSTTT
jgi:hypothetical protein